MVFYVNVKIPVIVSGDATFPSIAMGMIQYSIEELQTTEEARRRVAFQGRDESQRREEYHTTEHSPSKERYEGREQVQATEETRSTEEHQDTENEDQTEMLQHKRRGHSGRGCCLCPESWTDSDSEKSLDSRFELSHNLADAGGLGISCGLPAFPAKVPYRAGPPQVSKTNSNDARRPPGPGPTRFDHHLENLMYPNGRPTFPSAGDAPIQASRAYQSPAGNSHAAASSTDASRNLPRECVELYHEMASRIIAEFHFERMGELLSYDR